MKLVPDFSDIDPTLLQKAVTALKSDLELTHKTHLTLINKAFGLPDNADPSHKYSHRTGTYGDYDHFFEDQGGNYWKYTNAPGDHAHHDPMRGAPMVDPHQPMPHTAPEYFTKDGKKRHAAVPAGAATTPNPSYHPDDPANTWYESYTDPLTGSAKYSYLDRDVQNNPALHVQYNLRVVDSNILKYRQYAAHSFQQSHAKDRLIGLILILLDQAFYNAESLLSATVEDLVFTGKTMKLLGRKFTCDDAIYQFFIQLRSNRQKSEPLFVLDTVHGTHPIGARFLSSVFKTIGMSPRFLVYWHATQMYSEIFHRLHDVADEDQDDLEQAALTELGDYLNTDEDIEHLIDAKVRKILSQTVSKSLKHLTADSLGVPHVKSDLIERTADELSFSKWLHDQPFHDEQEASVNEEEPSQTKTEKSIKITFVCPTATTQLDLKPHALYSSQDSTCASLASKILMATSLSSLSKSAELNGPKPGKWKAGSTSDQIEKSLLSDPKFAPAGGESILSVFNRIQTQIDGIIAKSHPGDHVCLIVERIPYLLLNAVALGYSADSAPLHVTASAGMKSEYAVEKSTNTFKVLSINTKV